MPRPLSFALLVAGIILLVLARDSSQSVASTVSKMVSGTATDRTLWLTTLGIFSVVAGGLGLFFRKTP